LLATLVSQEDDAFEEMVLVLAFSEDGSKLASSSSNGHCKVSKEGRCKATWKREFKTPMAQGRSTKSSR